MSIKDISTTDLRRMKKTEGLVFQGCGGDPQEWVDGINDMLIESKVLLSGTRFSDVYRFENNGLTCLLFPFNPDVKLDTGKLAMWRLSTHSQFGGTWLSDYVPNKLGGYIGESQARLRLDWGKRQYLSPCRKSGGNPEAKRHENGSPGNAR